MTYLKVGDGVFINPDGDHGRTNRVEVETRDEIGIVSDRIHLATGVGCTTIVIERIGDSPIADMWRNIPVVDQRQSLAHTEKRFTISGDRPMCDARVRIDPVQECAENAERITDPRNYFFVERMSRQEFLEKYAPPIYPQRHKPVTPERALAAIQDLEEYKDNFKIADQFERDVAELIEGNRIAAIVDATDLVNRVAGEQRDDESWRMKFEASQRLPVVDHSWGPPKEGKA